VAIVGVGIATNWLDSGRGWAAVGIDVALVADILTTGVGGGIAFVTTPHAGTDAQLAGPARADAEPGTGLDQGESGFGLGRAEDGSQGPGDRRANHGPARGPAANELCEVVETSIVQRPASVSGFRRRASRSSPDAGTTWVSDMPALRR
jgi:hypothetical protein